MIFESFSFIVIENVCVYAVTCTVLLVMKRPSIAASFYCFNEIHIYIYTKYNNVIYILVVVTTLLMRLEKRNKYSFKFYFNNESGFTYQWIAFQTQTTH